MKINKNYSLKNLNAFRVEVKSKFFVKISNLSQLRELLKEKTLLEGKVIFLGGGTNTFFTKNFDGLVVKIDIKGVKIIKETKKYIIIEAGAGENWHKLVTLAVQKGWAGIENLSLIPGTVGAAPVQNIAAYGQNFEDVLVSLAALDLIKSQVKVFTKKDCKFSYRSSFFKEEGKGKFTILRVRIKLLKKAKIDLSYHSRYESLVTELEKIAKPPYSLLDISKAVSKIRKRKFVDWEKFGNAGSFFLNPVITKKKLKEIQKEYPGVQYYPVEKLVYPKPGEPVFSDSKYVKVAAGWLLEELGWKGKRIGKVGTSPFQALVIINYGGATPEEILSFANTMRGDFKKAYGIELKPEVNII